MAIATFVSGMLASIGSVLLTGTYQQTSATRPLLTMCTISIGFIIFIYANRMRSVLFMGRIFFLLLLLGTICSSATYIFLATKTVTRHPVDDLVYKNRIEADRWLRHATVSTTLKLAVKEYGERHHGRDPPRNFDKWFEFARQRKSVVIDRFDQIERDILPFWGQRPGKIRNGLEFLKGQPGVSIISIADGKASHNSPADLPQREMLDEIVALISAFVEHLPVMEIAINLQERPRVLVPWNEVHQLRMVATQPGFHLISGQLGKRDGSYPSEQENQEIDKRTGTIESAQPYVSAHQFRQLEVLACPPGSPSRSGVHWDVRDLCTAVSKSQWRFSLIIFI
jgi:hypothetical protein